MYPLSKLSGRAGEGEMGPAAVSRLVAVYLVAGGGYTLAGGGGAPSVAAAAAKCAPVLCLALCTALKARQGCVYSTRICLGLVLSALGDALLVWRQLAPGMLAFLGAHAAYTAAFPARPLLPRRAAALAALATAEVALLLRGGGARGAVAALVPVYAAAVAAAAWRGAAAGPVAGGGVLLFALSDSCLACHMFYCPLPYSQLIVMSTYYAAQLLIALSALAPHTRLGGSGGGARRSLSNKMTSPWHARGKHSLDE